MITVLAAKVTETDFGIAAIVVVVMALLGYRLLRRDSGIRLTRIGVFLERDRYDDEAEEIEDDADTKVIEKHWPSQEER